MPAVIIWPRLSSNQAVLTPLTTAISGSYRADSPTAGSRTTHARTLKKIERRIANFADQPITTRRRKAMSIRRMWVGLMSGAMALATVLSRQAMADLTPKEAAELDAQAKATLATFEAETKGADAVFAAAKGILVCPSITKGGFLIGVESGNCVLTKGSPTPVYYGTSAVKAGLLGGLSSYSMIVVLNTDTSLAKFTSGTREWELGADASVAVAKVGAAGSLDTTNLKSDTVVFVFGSKGLMADVSFEGSRFKKQDVK
jgi:lipid-binding SYLF domain-containing protein